MELIIKYLLTVLKENDTVVLGLSGGPDSIFLLNALLKFKNIKNIEIICAHINHNVRIESEEEYKYIKELCNENKIILEYLKLDKINKGNFHDIARNKRYTFFKKVCLKYNTNIILTAHHGDDLLETVLMRIIRGSNLGGYGGFKQYNNTNNYVYIKPLIEVDKNTILEYLHKNNIKYLKDLSNDSSKYTRNRIRNQVIPILKLENKNLIEKIMQFSDIVYETDNYINELIEKTFNIIYKENNLDILEFNKLNIVLKRKIIQKILNILYKDKINKIENIHISIILELIDNQKPNLSINLPNNIICIKKYNLITFEKLSLEKQEYKHDILKSKKININNVGTIAVINESILDNNYICRLNSKDITLPLFIRSRNSGDKIKVKNLNGQKKISDIFIDVKMEKSKRDVYPILVDANNEILWIPGLKKSIFDRTKEEKYDILLKYSLNEGEFYE